MTLPKLLLCYSSFIGEPFCYVQCPAITFWWLANWNYTAPTFDGCWVPIFPWFFIAMFTTSAKNIWPQGEHLSIQHLWATAWLLVTRFSLIYLVDEFITLFMVLLNKMRMLGKSKVCGANQRNEGVRWVQDFLVLPQGFSNFPSAFLWVRWNI